MKKNKVVTNPLAEVSLKFTEKIGTTASVIIHTLLFVGIFSLHFFGFSVDQILLILTTAVSLEAIYLSIFIQMTINRNTESLKEVEKDVDEIQEDVDEIQKDVDEIQEDVDEIQADDKIGELIPTEMTKTQKAIEKIDNDLRVLLKEVQVLRKKDTN